MSKAKDTEQIVVERITAFLLNKSIWVWWVFYLAATAALFGIFRLALFLLGIQPWIGVLVLVVAGISWGSVKYFRIKEKVSAIKASAAKTVKTA